MKSTDEALNGLCEPMARKGEQQFAVICRQRSGQDSQVISPVVRVFEIEKLGDIDQQDCVDAALILAEMIIGRCKQSNRNHAGYLLARVSKLINT